MNFNLQVIEDLAILAGQGDLKSVKQTIKSYKPNINRHDSLGRTPLYTAAQGGHLAVVNFLLEQGADVNKKNRAPKDIRFRQEFIEGQTPLHGAAVTPNPENVRVLQILLEKGANINAQDAKGRTALMEAADFGHPDVVKFLLLKNANPELRDRQYKDALGIAKAQHRDDIVRVFQEVASRMAAEVAAAPRNPGGTPQLPPGLSAKIAQFSVPKGGRTRRRSKTSKRRPSKN